MRNDDGHIGVSELISDLIAGVNADYDDNRFDEALAGCDNIRTLCRDNFLPTKTIDEIINRIKIGKDSAALDTLWGNEQLGELKW